MAERFRYSVTNYCNLVTYLISKSKVNNLYLKKKYCSDVNKKDY